MSTVVLPHNVWNDNISFHDHDHYRNWFQLEQWPAFSPGRRWPRPVSYSDSNGYNHHCMIIMIIMIMMITNNENDNMTISGQSILQCQPISKCSLVETTFLLLVTVSTVRSSPLLSSSSNYKFLSKVKV